MRRESQTLTDTDSIEYNENYVRRLFSTIAPRYDLLNSLLSLNVDKSWRRLAARVCSLRPGDSAIDVGTGTADLAIELSKYVGKKGFVAAIDFCEPMLFLSARKLGRMGIQNIQLVSANAQRIPFASGTFHAAVAGFVVRNVSRVETVFAEMTRVVRSGGRVVCLEFARPNDGIFGRLFKWYFHTILPYVGGLISGNFECYKYLPSSVDKFLSKDDLSGIMASVGLGRIEVFDLTGGIAAVHVGVKK